MCQEHESYIFSSLNEIKCPVLARRWEIAAFQLNPISTAKNLPPGLAECHRHQWHFPVEEQAPSEKLSHAFPRTCVLMVMSVSALVFGSDHLNQLVCPCSCVRQWQWFPVISVSEVWLQEWHWLHSLSSHQQGKNSSGTFLLPSQGTDGTDTSDTNQGVRHSALTKPNVVCKGNKARRRDTRCFP